MLILIKVNSKTITNSLQNIKIVRYEIVTYFRLDAISALQ